MYLSYQQGEDFDFKIDIEKRENESLFIQFNTWNAQNDGLTISKSLNLYVPKNKD
ncbi:hypothetical protein IJM86_08375 [bacterium]|nr:hypothetical protein [bacterium]